jgi:hypothetical protein
MFARTIRTLENHRAALRDAKAIDSIRAHIRKGDAYVARGVFPAPLVERIREYLAGVGRNSLPNYAPIAAGCPNFHRLNDADERSYVKGRFHQFSFFPWNQDVFNLFELSREVYYMRNLLSGNRKDRFLGRTPEDGCAARLSFQFYPRGVGGMNKHRDPVGPHQLVVPTLVMSRKGEDFSDGGAFVESRGGRRTCLDDVARVGDVVYFNAQVPHGVETIDPGAEPDWLSFRGRWVLLFAINKLSGNAAVADAVDLERP